MCVICYCYPTSGQTSVSYNDFIYGSNMIIFPEVAIAPYYHTWFEFICAVLLPCCKHTAFSPITIVSHFNILKSSYRKISCRKEFHWSILEMKANPSAIKRGNMIFHFKHKTISEKYTIRVYKKTFTFENQLFYTNQFRLLLFFFRFSQLDFNLIL